MARLCDVATVGAPEIDRFVRYAEYSEVIGITHDTLKRVSE